MKKYFGMYSPISREEEGQYLSKKPRLTTCQQPRSYVGGKRYPELLGVKGAQAESASQRSNDGAHPRLAVETGFLE